MACNLTDGMISALNADMLNILENAVNVSSIVDYVVPEMVIAANQMNPNIFAPDSNNESEYENNLSKLTKLIEDGLVEYFSEDNVEFDEKAAELLSNYTPTQLDKIADIINSELSKLADVVVVKETIVEKPDNTTTVQTNEEGLVSDRRLPDFTKKIKSITDIVRFRFPFGGYSAQRAKYKVLRKLIDLVYVDKHNAEIVSEAEVNDRIEEYREELLDQFGVTDASELEAFNLAPKQLQQWWNEGSTGLAKIDEYIDWVILNDFDDIVSIFGKDLIGKNLADEWEPKIQLTIRNSSMEDSVSDQVSEISPLVKSVINSISYDEILGEPVYLTLSLVYSKLPAVFDHLAYKRENQIEELGNILLELSESPQYSTIDRKVYKALYDNLYGPDGIANMDGSTDLITILSNGLMDAVPLQYLKVNNGETLLPREVGKTDTAEIFKSSYLDRVERLIASQGVKNYIKTREKENIYTSVENDKVQLISPKKVIVRDTPMDLASLATILSELTSITLNKKELSAFVKQFDNELEARKRLNYFVDRTFEEIIKHKTEGTTELNLDYLGAEFNELLKIIGKSHDIVRNNNVKSTVVNVEGNQVASFGIYNPLAGIKARIGRIKDLVKNTGSVSVLNDNPFVRKPEAIHSFMIRDGVRLPDKAKHVTKMSKTESFLFDFEHAYVGTLLGQNHKSPSIHKAAFNYTVFSDKSTHYMPVITGDITGDTSMYRMTPGQLEDYYFETQQKYHSNLEFELINDYNKIFGNIKSLADINKALSTLTSVNELLDLANEKGVVIYEQLHYTAKSKEVDGVKIQELQLKPLMVDRIGMFKSNDKVAFRKEIRAEKDKFAKWLTENGIEDLSDESKLLVKELTKQDVIKKGEATHSKYVKDGTLHPLMERFFYQWNIVSSNMNQIMSGSLYQYKGNTISQMYTDSVKRNVQQSSNFHSYNLGLKNGISNRTKVAFIADPQKKLLNILGQEQDQDVSDGASFVLMSEWIKQQNSLSKFYPQGIAAKSIGTYRDERLGVSTLIKHAQFSITNERIRQSQGNEMDWSTILQKMMGDTINRDIIIDFTENPISYYDPETDKIIHQTGVVTVPEGTSMYDLWKNYLGGEYSVTQRKDGRKSMLFQDGAYWSYDNSSWDKLVEIEANNLDIKDNYTARLHLTTATKTGRPMVNTTNVLNDSETSLKTVLVNNNDIGIQLIAEHNPSSDYTTRIISQIISAAVFEGNTLEEANNLYRAISALAESNLDERLKIHRLSNQDVQAVKDLVIKESVRIASQALETREYFSQANELLEFKNNTPLDNSQIQKLIGSTLNNLFSKKGILHRFPGGQMVVAPSDGNFEIYTVSSGTLFGETINKPTKLFRENYLQWKKENGVVEDAPSRQLNNGQLVVQGQNFMEFDTVKILQYLRNNKELSEDDVKALGLSLEFEEQLISQLTEDKNFLIKTYTIAQKNLLKDIYNSATRVETDINGSTIGYDSEGNILFESTPPEVILPAVYFKEFKLPEGIALEQVTPEFFEKQINSGEYHPKVNVDFYDNGTHYLIKGSEAYNNIEESYPRVNVSDNIVTYNIYGSLVDITIVNDASEARGLQIPNESNIAEVLQNKADRAATEDVAMRYEREVLALIEGRLSEDKINQLIDREYTALLDRIKPDSMELYRAFQKSLESVIARIPAQGAQSFMGMKVVGFHWGEKNSLLASPHMLWFQGADMDIDKGNVMGYTFNKDGTFIGWGDTTASLNPESENYYENQTPFNEDGSLKSGVKSEGLKNYIVYNLYKAINNPKNLMAAQTPISMDTHSELADQYSKDEFHDMNPASISDNLELQAVGKDVIGLTATDIKSFSAITTATVNAFLNKPEDLKYIIKEDGFSFNGKKYYHVANIPLTEVDEETKIKFTQLLAKEIEGESVKATFEEQFEHFKQTSSGLNGLLLLANSEQRQEVFDYIAETEQYTDQVWEQLSSLLSAATDNAKELILGRINVDITTAPVVGALTMLGVPVEQIVEMVNDPTIKTLIKASKSNIFTPNKFNKSLRNQLIDDLVSKSPGPQTRNMLVSMDLAAEVAVIGKVLGINQGTPNSDYAIYKFQKNLESFITAKVGEFDFERFLFEDEYAQGKIDAYNDTKTFHNVLYIIRNNPHFMSQLKTVVYSKNFMSAAGYKLKSTYQFLDRIQESLYPTRDNSPFDERQFNRAMNLMDSLVVDLYYQAVPTPKWKLGKEEVQIKHTNDRLKFVNWVHETFLPDIKRKYGDNDFLKDLIFDKEKGLMRLAKDLADYSEQDAQLNITAYQNAIQDLIDLSLTDSSGNKVIDVLTHYSLITSKEGMMKHSYAKLIPVDQKRQFYAFQTAVGRQDNTLLDIVGEEALKSLVIYGGFAPRLRRPLSDKTKKRITEDSPRIVHDWIQDKNTKQYEQKFYYLNTQNPNSLFYEELEILPNAIHIPFTFGTINKSVNHTGIWKKGGKPVEVETSNKEVVQTISPTVITNNDNDVNSLKQQKPVTEENKEKIKKVITEQVTQKEIKDISTEEQIKQTVVLDKIYEELISDIETNNTEIKPKKTVLGRVVNRIKNTVMGMVIGGSIILTTSSFYMTPVNIQFNLKSIVQNILPQTQSQWALRILDKKGLIEMDEQKVLLVEKDSIPIVKETPKPDKIFQIIGTVADNYNPSDSLMSYRSQWDNSQGFRYIPMPVKGGLEKSSVKVSGVLGVGHFMLDASVAEGRVYSHEYNQNYLKKAKSQNHWIPAFKRNTDGSVQLKYKKPADLDDTDIVVTPLRQMKFSDIRFDKTQKPAGFKSNIKELTLKDGSGTYLIFKDRDSFGRFSGGSVVFIFNDKYGNTIVRDFAGSINQIENEGLNITKQYNLQEGDLTLGYHDVGSFSAKPKAKKGIIDTKQWSGFNPHEWTGGALLIPIEGNVASVKQSKVLTNTTEEFNEHFKKGFFKDFNIDVQEYQSIKESLGYDATQMVDLVTKFVALNQGERLDKSVAYFAYSLLGKSNNKIRSELNYRINSWSKYQELFNKYSEELLQSKGFIADKNEWKKLIREKIIIDYLAETIVNYYNNPVAFEKIEDKKWSASDFTFIKKLYRSITKLLNSFGIGEDKSVKLNNIANNIAHNLINQEYDIYNYDLAEGQVLKHYKETIESDPFAKNVVEFNQSLGLILTGSLSLRRAGKVYRTAEESLHDLDFVVPYDVNTEISESVKNAKRLADSEPNSMIRSTIFTNAILPSVRKLKWYQDFIKQYPSFKETVAFVGSEHAGTYDSLTLTGVIDGQYDENGKLVPDTGYVVDFFIRFNDSGEEHDNYFKLWKETMIAKLQMGRSKDFVDYKAFVPYIKSKDIYNFYYPDYVFSTKDTTINLEQNIVHSNKQTVNIDVFNQLVDKLQQLNPEVEFEMTSTTELKSMDYSSEVGGKKVSDSKAFVLGNKIYLNMDLVTTATPIHELAHMFLPQLKIVNRALYDKLLTSASNTKLAKVVANSYPELSGEALNEEILIHLLEARMEQRLNDEVDTYWNTGNLWDRFVGGIKQVFNKLFGKNTYMDELNGDELLNADLFTLLDKIGDQMMKTSLNPSRLVDTEYQNKLITELIKRGQLNAYCQ